MKAIKYLLIFIILILTVSCSEHISISLVYEYEPPADSELPFMSPLGAINWVEENMIYISDDTFILDDWQSPHETYKRMMGDCEDPVIFVMYYCDLLNVEQAFLLSVYSEELGGHHAMLEINGRYINFFNEEDPEDPTKQRFHASIVSSLEDEGLEFYKAYTWNEIVKKNVLKWD